MGKSVFRGAPAHARGCVCVRIGIRYSMFVCPSDRHFSMRLFTAANGKSNPRQSPAIYGIAAAIIIIVIVAVAGTRVLPRPASHQPRHVHDTLALQSVCVCLPLHITVFASVTTSSPNQTARPSANMCCVLLHLLILPRNALKRVLLAQSGQQRSIEVTWRACYGPATPQSLPLGQIPPPSRFPWLLLSCHATFAPLALNHWLIAEPLVHQINSKHQARMSSITFIGLAAKTGTRPLFPTSHHVTKLIWRSGHKQLVSKTKQLQSPAGCEEVRNFGWGSSEERPDSRGVTLVSREYLFLDL